MLGQNLVWIQDLDPCSGQWDLQAHASPPQLEAKRKQELTPHWISVSSEDAFGGIITNRQQSTSQRDTEKKPLPMGIPSQE